jgi:glycerol-3-phosphate dehydrogenase
VRCVDKLTGDEFVVRAKAIVLATGAWIASPNDDERSVQRESDGGYAESA